MGDAPDPFQSLLDEHEDFLDNLSELEATLDEMMGTRQASDANRAILDEAIRFFEEDLLPHFDREDAAVLPPLEARIGRFGTMVNIVAYEHEEIRREIAKFKEAHGELESARPPWPAIQELNRHGIFTIQFLWDHFRKERDALFPVARQSLEASELESIRTRLTRA